MSPSSISNSKRQAGAPLPPPLSEFGEGVGGRGVRFGWRRLWRELLRVAFVLLLLEMVFRIEPIKSLLSDALDPYENLLWYSSYMPAYQDQLQNGPHYNLWLVGSSHMMTGLQPQWVQQEIQTQGMSGLTVQNYGLTNMLNLYDMAAMFDRWMFQFDQPDYVVIGLSGFNFSVNAIGDSLAHSSPMERTYIFPDSVDDYGAGWLFRNSALYRYALLARNATFIPRDQTTLIPRQLGGYVEASDPFDDCDMAGWVAEDTPPGLSVVKDFASLDYFIGVLRKRNIPVAIVNIPRQYCSLRNAFPNYQDYANSYLKPVADHLRQAGVPFLDLDTRFYAQVAQEEQYLYFRDYNHPNSEGARLFSQWTGEFVADWLKSQP